MSGWIGVDLDGTLARYDGWQGETHIGEPIAEMVRRVKKWIAEGQEVRIFTARVSNKRLRFVKPFIEEWCHKHIGTVLPITCEKDYACIEIWDDRAVTVVHNTGARVNTRPGAKCLGNRCRHSKCDTCKKHCVMVSCNGVLAKVE